MKFRHFGLSSISPKFKILCCFGNLKHKNEICLMIIDTLAIKCKCDIYLNRKRERENL